MYRFILFLHHICSTVSKTDIEALEKEISIDIQEFRREFLRFEKRMLKAEAKSSMGTQVYVHTTL